jgi:peptide/nickel transport system permease protein
MIAGFYRRAIDATIVAVLNIILAIPGLVLLLTVISFLAPPGESSATAQTMWVTLLLSVLVVPTIARVTRAQTMVWSDRDFIMASRTLGTRNIRIIVREIFPNIVPALVSFAFVLGAALIIVEAALAFFGIGDVSGVSWGLMIQNGRSQLERSPHMVLFPALFMFLTILALNFVGDQLRARFDVRESGI